MRVAIDLAIPPKVQADEAATVQSNSASLVGATAIGYPDEFVVRETSHDLWPSVDGVVEDFPEGFDANLVLPLADNEAVFELCQPILHPHTVSPLLEDTASHSIIDRLAVSESADTLGRIKDLLSPFHTAEEGLLDPAKIEGAISLRSALTVQVERFLKRMRRVREHQRARLLGYLRIVKAMDGDPPFADALNSVRWWWSDLTSVGVAEMDAPRPEIQLRSFEPSDVHLHFSLLLSCQIVMVCSFRHTSEGLDTVDSFACAFEELQSIWNDLTLKATTLDIVRTTLEMSIGGYLSGLGVPVHEALRVQSAEIEERQSRSAAQKALGGLALVLLQSHPVESGHEGRGTEFVVRDDGDGPRYVLDPNWIGSDLTTILREVDGLISGRPVKTEGTPSSYNALKRGVKEGATHFNGFEPAPERSESISDVERWYPVVVSYVDAARRRGDVGPPLDLLPVEPTGVVFPQD